MIFKEVTDDHGAERRYCAEDNRAIYIVTSARGHDLIAEYNDRYPHRHPSARWYNRHFKFERVG